MHRIKGFTHVERRVARRRASIRRIKRYQVTSYYKLYYHIPHTSTTSGAADALHQAGIGVIVTGSQRTSRRTRGPWDELRRHSALRTFRSPNVRGKLDWGTYVFDFRRSKCATFW